MRIEGSTALVTGANRGIGRAIVGALVAAGAAKVYAAARDTGRISAVADGANGRVVPIALDVTDSTALGRIAASVPDVQLLVNNAGVLDFGNALEIPIDAVQRNFAVNFYGPLQLSRALAPVIERNGGGAIVNVSSVVAFASMPALAGYNASKAALWSLTQSLRGTLGPRGINVHGVFPGPVDTDMAAEITFPKTSPEEVARAIVAGIESGDEDIYPDPMARQVYAAWSQDHKAVERQFASM